MLAEEELGAAGADLDAIGFAAENLHVGPVLPSSKVLVVTPGDGITAEAGYLRSACATFSIPYNRSLRRVHRGARA